jgi:hypothetical protein
MEAVSKESPAPLPERARSNIANSERTVNKIRLVQFEKTKKIVVPNPVNERAFSPARE